jgi:hypothetical protein
MDAYVKAFIKTHVRIDSGGRAFIKDKQIEVHIIGGVKKIVLPISKILYTFEDIKRAGGECQVVTLASLARAGGEGRWKEVIQERKEQGIPSNVYIANARTINLAIANNKTPPPIKWIGRIRDKMTEVYDTIDQVIDAMDNNRWKTEFSKGRNAKRKTSS